MRAVNLLPADRRGTRHQSGLAPLSKQPLLVLSIVVAIAVLGGIVLAGHSASSTVASRQNTLSRLDEQIAKLPKPKPVGGANADALRQTAVTSVATRRTTWDGFLGALSRVMPEDVWLLSLSTSGSGAAGLSTNGSGAAGSATPSSTPSQPTGFTLTGYTYSQPSVARLMRRLVLVPWLQDVSLTTSTKTTIADHTVYQFTLGATVVPLPEVRS
jgi:Tfp pilus assembly protein PilN